MNFKIPNIKHLQVFLAVMDLKSITRASKKVFLSQPAITQAIVKLEGSLNTTLFERRNDGMYITASGEAYAYRVRRALEMISNGVKNAIRIGEKKADDDPFRSSLQMLTTTQLRAVIAVSETQSFSLAGRNLGISQSSLHRAARELESLMGVNFFEKKRAELNVSKAARVLARAAKLAFAEISQGRDEVNALHDRDVGYIVIGCMPMARTSILPNAIQTFSIQYPDFNFKVGDGAYDDLLYHLRHGDFDLLIGALRFPVPSDDVIQEEIIISTTCIVARPDHPLCQKDKITASELAEYPWVAPPEATPTHDIFKTIFNGEKNNTLGSSDVPERLVETSSQILMRELLLQSDRLSIISEDQIQYELKTGTLKKISYTVDQGSRPIGITMRKAWEPTKTQLHFINRLREGSLLFSSNIS